MVSESTSCKHPHTQFPPILSAKPFHCKCVMHSLQMMHIKHFTFDRSGDGTWWFCHRQQSSLPVEISKNCHRIGYYSCSTVNVLRLFHIMHNRHNRSFADSHESPLTHSALHCHHSHTRSPQSQPQFHKQPARPRSFAASLNASNTSPNAIRTYSRTNARMHTSTCIH